MQKVTMIQTEDIFALILLYSDGYLDSKEEEASNKRRKRAKRFFKILQDRRKNSYCDPNASCPTSLAWHRIGFSFPSNRKGLTENAKAIRLRWFCRFFQLAQKDL